MEDKLEAAHFTKFFHKKKTKWIFSPEKKPNQDSRTTDKKSSSPEWIDGQRKKNDI